MEIQMELILDSDGFLRRECPHCEREFKWHHGPTETTPEAFVYPDVYWCPRCGQSAAHNAWWTPAQLDYQQEYLTAVSSDIVNDALRDAFGTRRSKNFKFTPAPRTGAVNTPAPPEEPDDMEMIAPPCHPWEPVKVPDDARPPHYCLLCGDSFAV